VFNYVHLFSYTPHELAESGTPLKDESRDSFLSTVIERRKKLHSLQKREAALLADEEKEMKVEQQQLATEINQLAAEKIELNESQATLASDQKLFDEEIEVVRKEMELRRQKMGDLGKQQEMCDFKCTSLASDWQNR